jgi:hypothetical protein
MALIMRNIDKFRALVIAAAGEESNWLYTPEGKLWFPWFRLYGLEKAVFDKSWKLPDIEKIDE